MSNSKTTISFGMIDKEPEGKCKVTEADQKRARRAFLRMKGEDASRFKDVKFDRTKPYA